MTLLKGKYGEAKIFASMIEEEAVEQIKTFLDHQAFEDSSIAVMPDVHSGKGSVVGFTMTANEFVIPNIIGVDIGCGVLAYRLGKIEFQFDELDRFIRRRIPFGFEVNSSLPDSLPSLFPKKIKKITDKISLNYEKVLCSIGSLGGGNHYIEIDQEEESGEYWLVIHSGSRNFGLQTANYHQKKAKEYSFKKNLKLPKDLEYLPLKEGGEEYLEDMKTAQELAHLNRMEMAGRIVRDFFNLKEENLEKIESIHNYINFKDKIIRKGAISAYSGEDLIIPLNMRDGAILGKGKGKESWNFSAPHGAGRVLSRTKAKKNISLKDYYESMKGVWSSCVSFKTLDESPFAYKSSDSIIKNIEDSVEIQKIIKPVYNFKAES